MPELGVIQVRKPRFGNAVQVIDPPVHISLGSEDVRVGGGGRCLLTRGGDGVEILEEK